MKILKEFKISNELNATKNIIRDFFGKLGFGIIPKGDSIEIIRGFKLTNRYISNPLNWKSKIVIEVKKINQSEVIVKGSYEIYPSPHTMNEMDKQVWEEFIQKFEEHIEGKNDSINHAKKLLRKSNSDKIKQIIGVLSFGTIIGLVVGVISNTVNLDWTYMTIGLIPLAFLIYFQFDDRLKK